MAMAVPCLHAQFYAEQVLNIGRNVLSMEDYVLAIQYFNQAAQAKPYLWDPYYYRALAKLMLDDFHGAEADASQAIDRNKYKYEAYRVRGFARMRLGLDSVAISDFDKGLEYVPFDKYFLYYKGVAQASKGDYAEADSTLSSLLNLYPRFEDAYITRAQSHLMNTDTVGALTDLNQALSINTNLTQPRLIRAEIALARKQWAEGAAEIDTVLNLTPGDASLHVNRAFARYNADDWAGAMEDYNYALDLEPDNYPALYNRALLRFQVQDLQGARKDFTQVLKREPDDFPARYNRGLINLELADYKAALADFRLIAGKYPRFYPVYYAMSRAYQGMGNNKLSADYFFKANDMVTRYVADPKHYKLDRPTIQQGERRENSAQKSDSPEEVMEHFNELVTVSQTEESTPVYGEKLRGRVQDIDSRVQPEEAFQLTLIDPTDELHPRTGTYAELTDINTSHWIDSQLFLTNRSTTPQEPELIQSLFDTVEQMNRSEKTSKMRPVDYLKRAVALSALKNYTAAIADLDKAIELSPTFASAYLQRAPLHVPALNMAEGAPEGMLAEAEQREALEKALADYDAALRIDPRLAYAMYGRGCVLYQGGDYQGAAEAFTKAAAMQPELGAAYFNRALCRLRLGDKRQAMADLSRAGEGGVVQAYNLLKRL